MKETQVLSEEDRQAVIKTIGAPFLDEFPSNTLRMRRNLIAAASIALVYKIGELSIDPSSSLFGVRLEGLTPVKIDWILFLITAYLLVHFVWNSLDHIQELRLRLTGTRVGFTATTAWNSDFKDNPSDHRQSTLFQFLLEKRKQPDRLSKTLDELQRSVNRLKKELDTNRLPETGLPEDTLAKEIRILKGNTELLQHTLKYLYRIPVSLGRFQMFFKVFLLSQSMRWLLLEIGAPIILGAWACIIAFPIN